MTNEANELHQLPRSWVLTSIGELSLIVTKGSTPTSYGHAYVPSGINFVKVENMVGGSIDRQSIIEFIAADTHSFLKRSQLQKDDVLFSIAGTIGRTAIVNNEDLPANINQAIALIRCPRQFISPHYVKNYLESPLTRISLSQKPRGIGMNNISLMDVGSIDFPLPPLPEQHRIVAKIEELFTRLDAGMQALKKIKLQLKRYRQSVLKAAFEGKFTADWREAHKGELEPASVLLDKIKAERAKTSKSKRLPPLDTSNLPKLPEGWVYLTLDYLVSSDHHSIKRGPFGSAIKKSCFVRSGYKVYEQGNVIYNDFARGDYFISEDKFNEMKGFAIRPGDILMSCSGTVGKIAIVPEGIQRGIINQALLKISLNNSIVATPYFVYLLRSQIDEVLLKNTRGSAMVNISSVKDLRQLPLAISPLAEQQRIVEEIERHLSVADEVEKVMEQSLTQSERLRQSILKRAFEGKLVPQDPADEPAEKLLERIKEEKAKRAQSPRVRVK